MEAGVLNVSTEQETDFWRETHYGFNRDNGHFFNCETNGDFTAELRVQAQYDELYDQAGIMVRLRRIGNALGHKPHLAQIHALLYSRSALSAEEIVGAFSLARCKVSTSLKEL